MANIQSNSFLKSLQFIDFLKFFWREELVYKLICIYLVFEYARPQTMYPVINILPYPQILLILTMLFGVFSGNGLKVRTFGGVLIVSYLIIICFSGVFGVSSENTFNKIHEFIAWVIIYFLIVNIVNTEQRFLFFIFLFLLLSLKMAQHSFKGWAAIGFRYGFEGTGGGSGWFLNSGEFAIQMCVFFPISYYFYTSLRKYIVNWKSVTLALFPLLALAGMISSGSRGGILGGASVILWTILISSKKISYFLIGMIIFILFFLIMPPELEQRFQEMGTDGTSLRRLERWEKGLDMATKLPVFGVGYENWAIADKQMYSGQGGECHNIFIECIAELGVTGLICFLGMIFFSFYYTRKIRKFIQKGHFLYNMSLGLDAALIGYLVCGSFVTVLYYPFFWINFALVNSLYTIVLSNKSG